MASTSTSSALVPRRTDDIVLAARYKSERIVDEAISAIGSSVGRKVDQMVRMTGWGPTPTAERILDILGQGEEARALALERLYVFFNKGGFHENHELLNLEIECIRLMGYALPYVFYSPQISKLTV
jgi:hypothetical protein